MNTYVMFTAGIDYREGLHRFSGNTAIYHRVLRMFAKDGTFQKLEESVAAGDVEQAFAHAHSLKGETGNLSLNRMYTDLLPLVEELRAHRMDNAELLLATVREDYKAAIAAINAEIAE